MSPGRTRMGVAAVRLPSALPRHALAGLLRSPQTKADTSSPGGFHSPLETSAALPGLQGLSSALPSLFLRCG